MTIFRNKNAIRSVILFSLILMFCGHAFCYANLSFSGASVAVDASKENASLISSGQFLATLYWRVRGALSAPLTVGMLSFLYLTASTLLIADMLSLTNPLSLFALCGTLMLNVSVTAINASMLHMADAYFLAFLFSVLGAWLCLIHPLGFIAAAACFAAVPGFESSITACGPALVLLSCVLRMLKGESVRRQLLTLAKSLMAFVTGFALYYAAALLFCRRQGVELNASFHWAFSSLSASYLAPIRQLFEPTTAYTSLCAVLMGILLALSIGALLIRLPMIKAHAALWIIICTALLPLLIGMPSFVPEASSAVSQRFGYVMLPVAIIGLLNLLESSLMSQRTKRHIRQITACMFGITFLSSIVFSNQVYLKKNLEYQSTLSIMTRVIEIAEQTEGFDPNYSTVAIIGSIEDSALSIPHKGFEHLSILDAAANNFTASTQEENIWYFWEIMGYPFNFISDYERDQLAATEAVKAMPAFPDKGCCQMIGKTLVIRLSE